MSASENDIITRARKLALDKQYERARALLNEIPNNPTAQRMLAKLDELDPQPTNINEAQEQIAELREELSEAEQEIRQTENTAQRSARISTGVLVFVGTLLGSLIGAAADFGGAVDTYNRFRALNYPELCVLGSDTILGEGLGMAGEWSEAFSATHEVRLNVNATGSTAGVRAAAEGDCAHVLAMSEPMTDSQYQSLVDAGVEIECAAEIGYDIVVFVTDINNPIASINRPVLRGMLLGQETSWGSLSTSFNFPVTVLVREGSGTTDLILRNLINFESNGGREFPPLANYLVCNTNEECLDRTLSINGSLYWVSASWVRTQPPQYLRVLPILIRDDDRPINPLRDEVDLDEYPSALQRPLYMYVVRNSSTTDQQAALSRDFLTYVRGVQGQQILESNFFFTHFDQPSEVVVPLPPGFDDFNNPRRQICKTT